MYRFKIIISFVLIFAIVFSFAVVPAHAGVEAVAMTFLEWFGGYAAEQVFDDLIGKPDGALYDYFTGLLNRGAAKDPVDPNCSHNWEYTRGGTNTPAMYRCSKCGQVMSMNDPHMRDAYNDYVSDLPFSIYNSDGSFLFPATHSYISIPKYTRYWQCPHGDNTAAVSWDCDSLSFSYRVSDGSVGFDFSGSPVYWFMVNCPIDGMYSPVTSLSYSGFYIDQNGRRFDISHDATYSNNSAVFYSAGYSFRISPSASDVPSKFTFLYIFLKASPPYYRVVPFDSFFGEGNTIYNINTRTTNITGDVYYFDNNGDAVVSNNCTIVNETNMTYYNPVTNKTYNYNNWSYDYIDRTYTCDCEDGITYITFGDDCIVIDDGENVYYIYYSVPGSNAPAEHVHDWVQTGVSQATCTDYGTKTYTCYECKQQKTELLPALGHAWSFVSFVSARFDDEGKLLENAYVLYACTRCGEEWHDYEGAGPPDSGGGDSDYQSILDWLNEFRDWLDERLDGVGGDTNVQLPDLSFDTDYDITIKDENGEDQKFSILGILAAFVWWKDVVDMGKEMVAQVSAAEVAAYAYDADAPGINPTGAPSIPVNLSAAESYYGAVYGDGEVEMLDLSWYTPYKKTVDQLVSGFLWLAFGWAVVRYLPGIISGGGLTGGLDLSPVDSQKYLTDGKKGRRR